MDTNIESLFWKFVIKGNSPDDCWDWIGRKHNKGYGYITARLPSHKYRSLFLAHRISYEIHFGPIPDRLLILHSCDNTSCTNPNHLMAGSQIKNMGDASYRKRMATGEKHGSHTKPDSRRHNTPINRLPPAEIERIYLMYKTIPEITYTRLGRMLGKTSSQVSKIIRYRETMKSS